MAVWLWRGMYRQSAKSAMFLQGGGRGVARGRGRRVRWRRDGGDMRGVVGMFFLPASGGHYTEQNTYKQGKF